MGERGLHVARACRERATPTRREVACYASAASFERENIVQAKRLKG